MENEQERVPAGALESEIETVVQVPASVLQNFEQLIAALNSRLQALESSSSGSSPKPAREKQAPGACKPTNAVWLVGARPEKFSKTPQIAKIQEIVHGAFAEGPVTDADMLGLIGKHPEISQRQDPVRILRYYKAKLESIAYSVPAPVAVAAVAVAEQVAA